MRVCRTCGVELEDDMANCPLCNRSMDLDHGVGDMRIAESRPKERMPAEDRNLLQNVLWQITTVLLISGIISTVIIDLSYKGAITWSIYPLSICLIVLSYASVMALSHNKFLTRIIVGWLISSGILFVVHLAIPDEWPVQIAFPILSTVNVLALALRFIIKRFKVKGMNVVAASFLAIALFCMITEAVISTYLNETMRFQWSIVVAACLLPVTAAILFMYFRTRKNIDLQKLFHT